MIKALLIILIATASDGTREFRYPQEAIAQCLEVLKASSTTRAHDIKNLGGGDFEDLDTMVVSMACSVNDESLDPTYANSRWYLDYENGVYIERKDIK